MEDWAEREEYLSGEDPIAADMAALASELPHRGANTSHERAAAAYILSRMKATASQAVLTPFPNSDSFGVLFAAYYGEFLVVTILALWLPFAAFFYGLVIFGCYLAEFTGYNVFARFLPTFESQNVVGYYPGDAPRKTIVVTAHYDSGRAGGLYSLAASGRLHWAHRAVVCAMFAIVLACLAEALRLAPADVLQWLPSLRAGLLGVCLVAAGVVLLTETSGDYVAGAVGNASGVAALLVLGDRLREQPLPGADVCLVATSGKETWMRGMRHFITSQHFDRKTTYFLNLAHVGAGSLGYTTGEGMLHVFPASAPMLAAARECAVGIPATGATLRAPTDAAAPLARGYHAMSVIGLNERQALPFWRSNADTIMNVDAAKIRRAADFAEGIVRRLEQED